MRRNYIKKRYGLIIPLLLLISRITFGQDIEITAQQGKYIIDVDLQLIVCNQNISTFEDLTSANSLIIRLDEVIYEFDPIPHELAYGQNYQVVSTNSQNFQLYFSQLPLINIHSAAEIQDEPKVLANFSLTDTTDTEAIISHCGIEFRGGFSQSYPKKSYDIELWEDSTGNNNMLIPLLNMRLDDDWLLLGMYNEPLRIRNVMNHELWNKIHTPYYLAQETAAKSGIHTKHIELAINNEYLGIYALCEQMDKKQLQLKKYNDTIRGELYKGISWGASTFTTLPSYSDTSRTWSGFEIKYPKKEEATSWETLYNFVDFVIHTSDTDFTQEIGDKFALENAIDYFIFLNLLWAVDNTGKNIFIAKYKAGEPYFYVPWDLDGTFGMIWDGTQVNIYNDILLNGFYERLLNSKNALFNTGAANRWFELRSTILTEENLIAIISKTYNFLESNGNYERESLKWGTSSINRSNLDYTYEWIENRLIFLDVYFGEEILNSTNEPNASEKSKIIPNPIKSSFRISNINESFQYDIYSINGIHIKEGSASKGTLIHIDDLSNGIYIIRLHSNKNNKFTHLKLIKH